MEVSIWSKVKEALFPAYCVNCLVYQEPVDLFSFVCTRCFLSIKQVRLPSRQPRPLDRLIFYGSYADPILQKLIFHFKYRFIKELATPLGELLIAALSEGGIETFLLSSQPVVTFIPLSRARERFRGFNQAALLASKVSSYFYLPLLPLLERRWLTPFQTSLQDRSLRKKNIKGAFRVFFPDAPWPEKVLIVDDVYTSGATLKEAALTLKRWGVKRVWAVTITGSKRR